MRIKNLAPMFQERGCLLLQLQDTVINKQLYDTYKQVIPNMEGDGIDQLIPTTEAEVENKAHATIDSPFEEGARAM